MNIGYIAHWSPEWAGGYQYDLFAISALSKASQEVNLLVFYSDSRLAKDLAHLTPRVRFIKLMNWYPPGQELPNDLVHRTPGVRFIKFVNWLSYRIIRVIDRRILRHLAGVEPIIFRNRQITNHNLDVCIGTAPFIDGVFANCANVLIIHDLWFLRLVPADYLLSNENWRPLRTQIGIFNADVIVVDSPFGRQDIIDYAKVDKDRVSIVPLPVAPFVTNYMNAKLLAPTKISRRYVFYPAHYLDFKNHAVILRALRLLKSRGILLSAVFCGPVTVPAYRDELIKMTAEFGLEDQVLFEGWLSDREVASLYRHATAVVISSKYGPTNMPIWEGMAFGVPVISSDVGDMPWQVGDAGLIFPAEDERVLADHLENIIKNPEMAKEYVRRGKRRFSSFELEVWGENLLKVVRRAVELNKAYRAAPWPGRY
jgi:glycosyltransferase involved in cell wall biosynthesis